MKGVLGVRSSRGGQGGCRGGQGGPLEGISFCSTSSKIWMVPKKSGCSRYGKQYLFLKNSTWIGPLEGVLGVPGELPKMSIITFLGGEFVNGIAWNGLFRNWATSRRWGVGIVLCNFFVVFRSLLFAKQWGEYAIKKQLFFNNSDIGIFGFQWKNDAENVISGGEIWGPGRSILR